MEMKEEQYISENEVIWCHILILLNFSESRMQTYIDLA